MLMGLQAGVVVSERLPGSPPLCVEFACSFVSTLVLCLPPTIQKHEC